MLGRVLRSISVRQNEESRCLYLLDALRPPQAAIGYLHAMALSESDP
jgi:hypothetical protein